MFGPLRFWTLDYLGSAKTFGLNSDIMKLQLILTARNEAFQKAKPIYNSFSEKTHPSQLLSLAKNRL